jgi:5'(3')-deoxyribonucleotidase
MTKVIGIDLDGVLYPWHDIIYKEHKLSGKTDLSFYEFWKQSWDDYYSDDSRKLYWDNICQIPIYYQRSLISPGDLDVLNFLAKKADIYYITARPKSLEFVTRSWLKENKLPYYGNVIFAEDKLPHIILLGCDYFIDDKIDTIENIKDHTNAILFKTRRHSKKDVKDYTWISHLGELKGVVL